MASMLAVPVELTTARDEEACDAAHNQLEKRL
jgi:hypothetical protein